VGGSIYMSLVDPILWLILSRRLVESSLSAMNLYAEVPIVRSHVIPMMTQ
jgi:hypothetical protein